MVENILLTVTEAAKILRVEPNTIRVWLSKGRVIPVRIVTRLGSRVFFNRALLLEWVNTGCKLELQEELNG